LELIDPSLLRFFSGSALVSIFVDTANNYQNEESEKWIGEWMEERGNRDRIVLATKFTVRSTPLLPLLISSPNLELTYTFRFYRLTTDPTPREPMLLSTTLETERNRSISLFVTFSHLSRPLHR